VEFGTHEELMALKGRYSYLYGLQTDALANDSKTNGIGKEAAGDSGVETSSDDEVSLEVNGESKHNSAEEPKSTPNGEATTSMQNGDITSISHKVDINLVNGTSI
jgi:hypothetical protein